jgi:hypothetical protein
VLVCPAKIESGSKSQVGPDEQDSVILPVKSLGAVAEKLNVVSVVPTISVFVGLVDVTEKTATPVPDRTTA